MFPFNFNNNNKNNVNFFDSLFNDNFIENIDTETEVSVHAEAYLYGGEEIVTATPEEVAYLMMRMERDENFLADHCDNIEDVDFSFLQSPDEYYEMKL